MNKVVFSDFDLGGAIRKAIVQSNLTQRQVAKAVGISPQALSCYVNNRRTPNVVLFYYLSQILHLDFMEIFQLSENKQYQSDYKIIQMIKTLSEAEKEALINIIPLIKEIKEREKETKEN